MAAHLAQAVDVSEIPSVCSILLNAARIGGSGLVASHRIIGHGYARHLDDASLDGVVLQVSNADKFVAERLSCVLRLPSRKGCR